MTKFKPWAVMTQHKKTGQRKHKAFRNNQLARNYLRRQMTSQGKMGWVMKFLQFRLPATVIKTPCRKQTEIMCH